MPGQLFIFRIYTIFLKRTTHIFLSILILVICSCSGSRKYFKAAERLEKQGLVSDAAEYYLEALQRKPTNVSARIKLKEVGQKHINTLSSEFFRDYNTQQLEASLETFERLKSFNSRSGVLDVSFDYPKTYEEDYHKAVETYCLKNYNQAFLLVSQKKYSQALPFVSAVKKYNPTYKNTQQLDIVSVCEPLYQSAITNLENKNYSGALNQLSAIKNKTDNYKDCKELLDLATAQQTKSFILFEPKKTTNASEKEIQDYLYNSFSQTALQKLNSVRIINNTPFQSAQGATDLNNSNNVDLIQAIRKATGADYFYIYSVSNKKDYSPPPIKSAQKGFEEIRTRKNDTLTITEYKPFDYSLVKAQRSLSYDFNYRLINAYTNQIIASQTQNITSQDVVEYQEFARTFKGSLSDLYPYNPQVTAPLAQYNARNWRNMFSARNSLKTFEELKTETYSKTTSLFVNSAAGMK